MAFIDSGSGGSSPGISGKAFGALGNAASDIFGGIEANEGDQLKAEGLEAESTDYAEAAVLAGEQENYTKQSTAVQEYQAHRSLETSQGKTTAELGAAGVTSGGSGEAIIRSNAQQGSLNAQLIGMQGQITEAGYQEQVTTDQQMAQYANSAAGQERSLGSLSEIGGMIGGALNIAGAAFML